MAGEQGFFRLFQGLQSLIPADGRKSLQEAVQTVSGLEVVKQRAHQHPRASKRRRAGHDGGIANDNRFHVSIMSVTPRVVKIAP